MKIGSISENLDIEKRISITPEIAKKYHSLGLEVIFMDNENHKNTWNNFTKFVLWGTVAVICVLVLMAIFLL